MPESRRTQAIRAARAILESEGEGALTMRRLADELGIRAPSLYKHVPDKAELEAALVAEGLEELGAALAAGEPSLSGVAAAYRAWALAHPHLYVLMTERPLPRDRLPAGLEDRTAAPLLAVLPSPDIARAAWAAAHGLAALELAGRFPPGADVAAAWDAMAAAFSAAQAQA